MSETGSKFGMLKNLQQATTQESTKAGKQESGKTEKQESAKAVKGQGDKALKQQDAATVAPTFDQPPTVELKHYSSYMPLPLFSQLQIYVAKQKAVRSRSGERVSIQNVIAEAVQEYLDKHDK